MRKPTLLALILCAVTFANAQSSGGDFTITSPVVGSGGGNTSGGAFALTGAAGQPLINRVMNDSPFTVRGGSWQPEFSPTSATVIVGGRVVAPNGGGLKNAIVTLAGGNLVRPFVALTGPFGYFMFEGVEVGHAYVVTVSSKRFGFAETNQVVVPFGDLLQVNFQANWEN